VSVVHIDYHTWLCSSSWLEPRHPLTVNCLSFCFFFIWVSYWHSFVFDTPFCLFYLGNLPIPWDATFCLWITYYVGFFGDLCRSFYFFFPGVFLTGLFWHPCWCVEVPGLLIFIPVWLWCGWVKVVPSTPVFLVVIDWGPLIRGPVRSVFLN